MTTVAETTNDTTNTGGALGVGGNGRLVLTAFDQDDNGHLPLGLIDLLDSLKDAGVVVTEATFQGRYRIEVADDATIWQTAWDVLKTWEQKREGDSHAEAA